MTELRVRGPDAETRRWDEPKPCVVLRRPEKSNERHIQRIRCTENCVHHRASDANPLITRKNPDGAERSYRMSGDRCSTADDVASQMIIKNGHQR